MSQVSYGTITIVDTTDIARIYMVYAKSVSNTTPPSDELTWSESIASAPGEGDFIWQKTVVEKAITEEKTYSDPVCVTGSSGQGIEKIINYYCNYGQGQPEEDYSGWQLEIPEYDESKPNYWTKVVVIYSDDTREDFQASGTIATFENEKIGMLDSLEVSLSPIQDLHGYDKPWVGGAGKNLFDPSYANRTNEGVTYAPTSDGKIEITGTATANSYSGTNATNYANTWIKLKAGTYTLKTSGLLGDNKQRLYVGAFTASGESITVYTTVFGDFERTFTVSEDFGIWYWIYTAKDAVSNTIVEIQLEEGSTATSFAPYSNICPISGWDEVETNVAGVNLFDKTTALDGYIENTDGAYHEAVGYKCTDYIKINGGDSYFIVSEQTAAKWGAWYDKDKAYISGITGYGGNAITAPNNATYMRLTIASTATGDVDTFAVNTPSTDTDYHAYQGQTYTTDLPQTVYGGTLDLVSGEVVIDRVLFEPTEVGNVAFHSATNKYYWTFSLSPYAPANNSASLMSDVFQVGSIYDAQNGKCYVTGEGKILAVVPFDQTLSTKALANAWLTDSKPQFCYKLATPTSYSLTPQEVQTLLGRNNVWSGGTVEVRGHTISKRDVMIYKDNGLTDVVDKSAEANTNAAEALDKANNGIVSTTQLWYQTNSTSAPSVPTSHSQVDHGTVTYDNWRSARPNNSVDSYKYYYYCYEYLHGDGTYTYSAEAILDTSNLSQYQIGALTTKVKNFWWDSNGAHVASGKNGNEVTTNTISTYGYHALMGLTGISFNYDSAKVVDLNGEVPSLDFYTPPVIENNLVTANGKLAMRLNKSSLNFYNPEDGETIQASLSTNGLIIQNGSIELGNSNSNIAGSITLSNQNFSRNINNITREDLRFAIGSNFGVKDDGTLYASNVDIEGAINVNDELNSNIYTKEEVNSGLEDAAATATNFIKTSIDGSGIRIAAQNTSAYLLITDKVLRFYLNDNAMSQFGYDEIFESYGVQAENIFIKGAGNALRLDNNVNGTYQGQYILETRANGHLSLKPGLRHTEEE